MSSSDGATNGRCAATYAAAMDNSQRPKCQRPGWELRSWGLGVSGSGRAKADTFIEAAHPIPLQVDRDVLVAERAQLADDSLADLRVEGARQLVASDLEPRQRVVMADAADAEAEIAKH